MRKELVWAGIIGISFGLIIGFGTWRVHRSMTLKEKEIQPTPLPQSAVEQFKISVLKPNDFDVITENPVAISGITKPSTLVIVSTDDEDYIGKSNEDGSFKINVDLISGVNNIKVTALNSQGNSTSQKILAVYSASFEPITLEGGTTKGSPKSYIGTITDISDSTIQIESANSQIQQIATDKYDISVANTTGTTSKVVKLADVAIGDFIIAMGYTDGNHVLDATRIVIANEPSQPQINTSLVKVTGLSKKSFDATPFDNGEPTTITPGKNSWIASYSDNDTNTIKFSDIDVDDALIVVSDVTGSPPIIRSLLKTEIK